MRKMTLDIHSNIKREIIDPIVEDKFINLSSLTNSLINKIVYNTEDYLIRSLSDKKPDQSEEYTTLDIFYPKETVISYPTKPIDNLALIFFKSKDIDPKYNTMVENLIRNELYDLFINYNNDKVMKLYEYGTANIPLRNKYGERPVDVFLSSETFKDKEFLNDFKRKYSDNEINKIIYDILGYMIRKKDINILDWIDKSIKFVTDDDKKIINIEEYNVVKLKGKELKFLETFSCRSSININAIVGGVLRFIESNPEILKVRSKRTVDGRNSIDTMISVNVELFFNNLRIGDPIDTILKDVLYSVDDFENFKECFKKNYTKIRTRRSDTMKMPLYEDNVFYSGILKDLKKFNTEVGVRWNDTFTYMKKYVEEKMAKTDKYELVLGSIVDAKKKYEFAEAIRELINDFKDQIMTSVNKNGRFELDIIPIMEHYCEFYLGGYEENLRDLEEEWFSKGYIIDWKSVHQDDVVIFELNS